MARQVVSTFGSKTTHSVPRPIDCSMKRNSRRTFTHFHVTNAFALAVEAFDLCAAGFRQKRQVVR